MGKLFSIVALAFLSFNTIAAEMTITEPKSKAQALGVLATGLNSVSFIHESSLDDIYVEKTAIPFYEPSIDPLTLKKVTVKKLDPVDETIKIEFTDKDGLKTTETYTSNEYKVVGYMGFANYEAYAIEIPVIAGEEVAMDFAGTVSTEFAKFVFKVYVTLDGKFEETKDLTYEASRVVKNGLNGISKRGRLRQVYLVQ